MSRNSENCPAARHLFDRKSAPLYLAGPRICVEIRGFLTGKWKRSHRSAFFRSKMGTDSSYRMLGLSEHAHIFREKVRTAPPIGICLIEIGIDLSCEVSDSYGNERICTENVETPSPPGICLLENRHRFILRGPGFA